MLANDVAITETILAITWTTSIWFLSCWLFSRVAGAATFQRAVWRTALLGGIILTLAELSGVTPGVHWWLQTRFTAGTNNEESVANVVRDVSDQSARVRDLSIQLDSALATRQGNGSTDATTRVVDFHEHMAFNHEASHDDVAFDESALGAVDSIKAQQRPYTLDSTTTSLIANAMWPASVIGSIWRDQRGAFLMAAWFLGTAVSLLKMNWDHAVLLWFRLRQPLMQEDDIIRRTRRLARQLGIRRCIAVRSSDSLAVPVAFGTWRPTIVLPSVFAEQFSDSHQDAVLAHELAHLAAHDPLWQLVANLACALLWWQPLVWFARKQLQKVTEWAADEATTMIPNGPELLAECLVELGRRLAPGRRLLWLSAAGPRFRSGLGRRVIRLLSLQSERKSAVPCRSIQRVAIASMLILSVSATGWARSNSFHTMGDMDMNILAQSWRRSVVAAAVFALAGFVGSNAPATRADERDVDVELEFTSNDERVEDGDVEAILDVLDVGEEEENVQDARLAVDILAAAENPDREHDDRRRQYKDRDRNEANRDRVEEIHKRIQDELAELPEDSRHEIAELIEALLRVERSHMRDELERGKVEMQLQLKDNERRAVEQARALADQAKKLSQLDWKGHHEAALDQFRRAHETWRDYNKQLDVHDDLVRRGHRLAPEAARNGDGGDRRQLGKFEGQLHELRDQMTHMHHQMSDMQRAMEKLMRSSKAVADPRQ